MIGCAFNVLNKVPLHLGESSHMNMHGFEIRLLVLSLFFLSLYYHSFLWQKWHGLENRMMMLYCTSITFSLLLNWPHTCKFITDLYGKGGVSGNPFNYDFVWPLSKSNHITFVCSVFSWDQADNPITIHMCVQICHWIIIAPFICKCRWIMYGAFALPWLTDDR